MDDEWYEFGGKERRRAYNEAAGNEELFTGILEYAEPPEHATTLMRHMPYRVDGTPLSIVRDEDISGYVGQNVEVVGKKTLFALEGHFLEEIFPKKMRLKDRDDC
ncbi:MAG: hypothetical protein HZB68_01405 [Candidatus Aenigmarchaeota archaeon]|nr:hypothetical protein [Candidatus Aenigmarchaeota archaeon]